MNGDAVNGEAGGDSAAHARDGGGGTAAHPGTTGSTAALRDRARGALLGLAVGDALGAPAENLRPSEIRRRWGGSRGS